MHPELSTDKPNPAPSDNGQAPNRHTRPLLPQHLADLRASGLTDETIRRASLYSETDPRRLGKLLRWRGEYPSAPALIFPFLAGDGSPLGGYVRAKPDRARPGGGKYESPLQTPNRLYVPPGGCTAEAIKDPSRPLGITEGEKKALAADQAGYPFLSIAGVWSWMAPRPKDARSRGYGPRKLIPDLAAIFWKGRTVYIVFDSDAAQKREVRLAAWHLARVLKRLGAHVKVATPASGPPTEDGNPRKVGLDDLLVAEGPEGLRRLLEGATEPVQPEDTRPVVTLGVEEHLAIEQAVKALAKGDRKLFQRGGQLVRVVRPSRPPKAKRFQGSAALRIESVPLPDLRTRLSRYSCCVTISQKDGAEEVRRAHPPEWLYNGVAALDTWPGIRHLEAVVESPVLRTDGTVLDRPGYDRDTGLLYRPSMKFPPMPEWPTRDDARRACEELLDIWGDFPFAAPHDRSAALSAVLTPLARFGFRGPAPLNDISANIRGAGKGLLVDTFAVVGTGRAFARASYSTDNDEMRKTITSLALAGETAVLLDNLTGTVGCASLDAALTADTWQDRVLGKNYAPRLPLLITWFATGNNIIYRADTARRVLRVRLESTEEKPEERTGFKRPDLLAWVRQERGRLLMAALTILSAYCRAGRPDQGLKPWGSFEGWSALVRSALVWAGQPDPAEGRMSAVAGGDREADFLAGLLAGWQELDPDGQGLTVAAALKLLNDSERRDSYPTVRGVLAEVFNLKPGQLPESGRLGCRLRSFCGRRSGGAYFASASGHGGVARWSVCRDGGAMDGGDGGDASPSICPPRGSDPVLSGGDGGDGGDVPLNPSAKCATNALERPLATGGETSPPSPPSPPPTDEECEWAS